MVLILLVVIVAAAFGLRRVLAKKPAVALPGERKRRDVTVTVKIMLNFVQTISFLGSFDLHWPPFVAGMFSSADSVSGMLFSTSLLSCVIGWSPLGRFVVMAVMVPVLVIVPATTIWVMSARHREREFTHSDEDEDYVPVPLALLGMTPMHLYTSVILVLLFLVYPTVTRQALEMLLCSEPINGHRFLLADVSVACGTADYESVASLALSVLIIITIGFPIASALLIVPFRNRLQSDKAQRRFGFLLKGYKGERFWYESVIMFRKAAVAASAVLLRSSSSTLQLWAGLLVQLTFMVLHVSLRPYKHRGHDRLELGCMVATIFLLVLGQGFLLPGIDGGGLTLLTVAVATVVLAALGACLFVIGQDLLRYAKQAKIAMRVIEAWKQEQADAAALAAAAAVDAGVWRRTPSAGKRAKSIFPGIRAAVIAGANSSDTKDAVSEEGGGSAAGIGGKSDKLGMSFSDLIRVERTANRLYNRRQHLEAAGARAGPSDGGSLASSVFARFQSPTLPGMWKTNGLQEFVKCHDNGATMGVADGSAAGRHSSIVESRANPLRRIRSDTSASDVVPGAPGFAVQRGLARRRTASRTASSWRGAGRETSGSVGLDSLIVADPAASSRASAVGAATPSGSGQLFSSSPWQQHNVTAMEKACHAKLAQQRRKKRQTLLPKSLRARRAEVESRWKRAEHAELKEPYWYNRQTRQISWEQPVELDKLDEAERATLAKWVRAEHPEKKVAFWKHPEMGETWKRPHGVPLRPEEAWIRTAHPINNLPCFLNLLTQETTWERPTGYAFTHTKLMHPEIQTLALALEARQHEAATPLLMPP